MQHEVTFAGFGGQGIMLSGKLLAYAGMHEGLEVVWIPSYGPEMRGGTAYCNVVLADDPIGSPVINSPNHAIVMNLPSLEKFGPKVKPDGLLVINASLIESRSDRNDIDQIAVKANEIAIDSGNARAANMAILGAYIGRSQVVPIETVEKVIEKTFASKQQVLEINLAAFHRGIDSAREE